MTRSDQHDADARPSEFASPTGLMHEADSACDGSKASETALKHSGMAADRASKIDR